MGIFPYVDKTEYYSKIAIPSLLIVGAAIAGVLGAFENDVTIRLCFAIVSVVLIIMGIWLEISLVNKTNEKIEFTRLESVVRDLENQIRIIELELKFKK